ncbi:MAG: glycosyltransferase, partial [Desulfobacterales bacterium]
MPPCPPPPALGMVLKGYPRISETFISNEILGLEQLGIKVHIFSMRHPRENFSHASVKQIAARVDYLPHTILAPLTKLAWFNLKALRRYPNNYHNALALALRRFKRTRRSATLKHLLQAGYLVGRLLNPSGVVHLHAHFAHSPTSVAMFAAQISGLPFSFTAHAKDIYTSHPQQLAEKIQRARYVLTCTRYNLAHLRNLAPHAKTPLHCIYHGIDIRLFTNGIQDPHELSLDPPYEILTVARLTAKKGISTVLAALQELKRTNIHFRYTLIGDGEDRETILSEISRRGLTRHCRYLGTQPHVIVRQAFARAHIFVIGCRIAANGDRDGIPNVIAESMAMGVPVVAPEVSAIPEMIIDNQTGLLVPPQDPRAMAAAITRLLTNRGLR